MSSDKYFGKINCAFVIASGTKWNEATATLWDCYFLAETLR